MKRIAALVSVLAILSFTAVLIGWMLARVAEHPGLPREIGELPPWFAGQPVQARKEAPRPLPAAEIGETSTDREALPPAAARVDVTGGEVRIALAEYRLVPEAISVRPGKITFVLRNEGRFAHNFHVEGPGVDAKASKFGPGSVARLEVTLQEGEYKISCPLSNHDKRGMHGTLLVTPPPKEG